MGREAKAGRGEIKQLLLLLMSSVGVAVLFSWFMIHYYGPTGQYYVKNILLSPEMTGRLDYPEGVSKGRFSFDRVEFRYYDEQEKSWKVVVLDPATYFRVYALIENESSMDVVPAEAVNEFNWPNPATLTLYVKSDRVVRVFQEVVFVKNGDLYRVMLRDDQPTSEWAYFHHRKIYDHVLDTILSVKPK